MDMKYKLVKPVGCTLPWPASATIAAPLTKLKCKQFMPENICLPHSCIDLSAPHSQPRAVVSLSLSSTKWSLGCRCCHKCCLITIISVSKPGPYRAINRMSSRSQENLVPLHMTWLYSKLIMYSTQRATKHTQISLYRAHTCITHTHTHTHTHTQPLPPHTCPAMTRARLTQLTRSCLHITWQK